MRVPIEFIDKDSIRYHKQLESLGNGVYVEVEVAHKTEIDAIEPALTINKEITKVVVYGEEYAQVVRCKDCRWYEPLYKDKEYDCPQGLYAVYADDYCSHGERREP